MAYRTSLVTFCPDPDCRAPIGSEHGRGCDTAVCTANGAQRLLHEHEPDEHDCGRDVWTGRSPGATEATEYGLFARRATTADAPLTGWIPCPAGTSGAWPDLTYLFAHGRWNPDRQRWEMPTAVTS